MQDHHPLSGRRRHLLSALAWAPLVLAAASVPAWAQARKLRIGVTLHPYYR
jgi:zinc transport system substrate-binding protein